MRFSDCIYRSGSFICAAKANKLHRCVMAGTTKLSRPRCPDGACGFVGAASSGPCCGRANEIILICHNFSRLSLSSRMEDLERFRQRWEPDEHWAMRREFILRHQNRFPENRLLCLAQTFVNMELLGCVYPAAVAEFVRELAKEVARPKRPKLPPVAPVAFVRASAAPSNEPPSEATTQSYNATPMRPQFVGGFANRAGLGCESRKRAASPIDLPDAGGVAKVSRKFASLPPGEATSARSDATTAAADPEDPTQLPKFEAAAQLIRDGAITGANILDKMQQVFSKCGFSLGVQFEERPAQKQSPAMFECVVCSGSETLGKASATNKKEAKRLAYQLVWDKFARTQRRPETPPSAAAPPKFEPIINAGVRASPIISPKSYCFPKSSADDDRILDLQKLVVVEAFNPDDVITTLCRTACANRLRGSFEIESSASGFVCTYMLGYHEIKRAVGDTKPEAKLKAASASVAYLQSVAPTLRYKQKVDGCGPELTKNTLQGPGRGNSLKKITSENIGHKLLKMMGWSGGGIGKEGVGIVDPVMLKETSGRQGLGFSGSAGQMGKNFKTKVHQMLKEFSDTVVLQDLVFSPEFDNEERKFMHSVARKYGLKSVSIDGPEGRFLTVRHKLSVHELVDRILASGPTEKYEVIMPRQTNSDES
ncbi:uncharacterized protein LOC144125246 [Amblyomma americanum]